MAESRKSLKPIWWGLVALAAIVLVAWTYIGTKKSNEAVQQATAAGVGLGTAYDPTTGRTVPAGATPGALSTNGPPPIVYPGGNSANGSAGGTIAGVNPQATPVPGGLAQGAEVPPAKFN